MSTKPTIHEELEMLFHWHPPRRKHPPTTHISGVPPLSFYDRHVAAELSLKTVKLLPSILENLSTHVDHILESIDNNGIVLKDVGSPFYVTTVRETDDEDLVLSQIGRSSDAWSVGRCHESSTGKYCCPVASTLVLNPRAVTWFSAIHWNFKGGPLHSGKYYAIDTGTLRVNQFLTPTRPGPVPVKLLAALDDGTRNMLEQLSTRFPELATWEITAHSVDGEEVLASMGEVTSNPPFSYPKTCLTQGYPPLRAVDARHISPDSRSGFWSTPFADSNISRKSSQPFDLTSKTFGLSKSSLVLESRSRAPPGREVEPKRRRNARGVKSTTVVHRDHDGVLLPPKAQVKKQAKDSRNVRAAEFLQHAWNDATRQDATFIVFHCGSFERIGFRHRRTQSLYLSDLIDVPGCENPGYGKIHVGLYMAVLRDVLDRDEMFREGLMPKGSGGPLSKGDVQKQQGTDERAPKRRQLTRNGRQQIFREINSRNLVFISLKYSIYNSPAPASFWRCAAPISNAASDTPPPKYNHRYCADEYITLIITSKIGEGATAVVHGATVEVETADGQCLAHEVVVKLAFEPDQQDRLRNEYSIYQSLASAEVKNIPIALGLFHDLEGDVLALIMTRGGICLPDRKQKASSSERAAFIRTLKAIHKAGYRHHDIRGPNLLVDDIGEVMIIDFDKADKAPSRKALAYELDKLKDVLDGEDLESLESYQWTVSGETKDSTNSASTASP